MSWMNLICCRTFATRSTNFARSFIALASTLFLLLPIFAVGGEYDLQLQDISDNLSAVLTYLNDSIGLSPSTSSSLWEMLDSEGQTVDDIRAFMLGENLGYVPSHNRQGTLPYYLWSLNSAIWGLGTQTTPNGQWSIYKDLQTILDNDDLRNSRLTEIRNLLRLLTNSSSASPVLLTNFVNVSVSPTSIVNVSGGRFDDVLAANPWWTTNSIFAMSKYRYDQVYPDANQYGFFSFPQFLSKWSAQLVAGRSNSDSIGASQLRTWYDLFGNTRNSTYNTATPYTWFDYMAEWQKSNSFANATYNERLLDALRSISNAVSSSSSSAFVTNDVFVSLTNFVSVLVTNNVSLRADDILAANPWWATNSVFVPDWTDWTWGDNEFGDYPRPTFADMDQYTFPDILSALMSSRTRNYLSYQELAGYGAPSEWWNQFGHMRFYAQSPSVYNQDMAGLYTFEDFVADALKSNLIAQVVANYDTLTATVARAYSGSDLDDDPSTNSVLASYSDAFDAPDTSGIEDSFSDTMDEAEDKLRDISDQYGRSGSPEIVVIPEFTIGGIHVREYRGSLDTSLTRVAHAVCVFMYTVFFIVSTLHLIKVEWAFWTSLGEPIE